MIDTDKYEGHTSDWKWIDINEQDDFYLHSEHGDIINHDTPDGKLAQDAPLLLEEVKRLREELKQTRESLWWCYDNYRFDGHPMTDVDWNFIGNLLGADMESEEE
tara:strand:+ start:1856 stop:2170 length:315 start_codon:yes stop_codon:yes gene_type:complete